MKLIITAILNFATGLITMMLSPIQTLIISSIPGTSVAFGLVETFFLWLTDFIVWVLSWLPFTPTFWLFLTSFFVFRLTIPLMIHTVKLVVAWWHALVP